MNRQKPRRKRGVILTNEGFHKLRTAKCQAESWENSDQRYTLEQLRLLEALEVLQERSLVHKNAALFSLSPIVREYINNQLLENKISYRVKSKEYQKNVSQILQIQK
jgi:ribonuclease HI